MIYNQSPGLSRGSPASLRLASSVCDTFLVLRFLIRLDKSPTHMDHSAGLACVEVEVNFVDVVAQRMTATRGW